jgi:hypothetical protein
MAEKEIKRVITIESSESLNTLNNLNARIKELKGTMGDLDITTEEYRQVSEEVTQLENVKRNAIRGVTEAVEGSYNAYSKELSILQKHRKTLNENTQEYKDMTKRVAELQQKLKDMDADVGVYSRNVGNYSSAFDGLQGAVDNAAKKLPQLSSGFAGFAAAMVEDIPKIIAQLQAMTAAEESVAVGNETMATTGELAGIANTTVGATATTAAAGETAMGTAAVGAAAGVSTLVKACTSWNVILLAIITVLQIFADDIQEWIKSLSEADEQLNATERAAKSLREEIVANGLGIGDTIVKVRGLKDEWDALGESLEARKKFIAENKRLFDELGVAINGVNDAEVFFAEHTDDYIEAVKLRAQADAAKRLAGIHYEEEIKKKLEAQAKEAEAEAIRKEKIAEQEDAKLQPINSYTIKEAIMPQEYLQGMAEGSRLRQEAQEAHETADALFALAQSYDNASEARYKFSEGTPPTTPTTTPTASTTSTKPMAKDDLIALTGGAIDASAEREALKVTLDARIRMTTANAEEREKIEKELAERLNEIEKARLDLTIVNLEAMLESEMLTNEQRLNIEAELIQAKIDLADMEVEKRKEADAEKLKSEEERAKKEKAVKDKEAKEEAEREKQMQSIKANMLNMTTSLIRQSAELFEEDSKERKALNAAAIVMDTYKAAMAAWTAAQGLPPGVGQAVGAANVAASIAMGAMQLANLFKVAPDGSNAEGALSSAQSAPNVASSMPASYTRSLQGDNELTEMNKDTRVYVVESDITNAQKSARVRVESATF